MTHIDLIDARRDLKVLFGLPPHDVSSNTSQGCGYFSSSLERKYGVSVEELCKLTGVRPR